MALTNDIRLIGYCGRMPTVHQTKGGRNICFLPIYTRHWVYSSEERKEFKELHWCVFSGKNADRAKRILMKGSQVYIRGAMHYHQVDHEGFNYTKPQIVVEDFMITTKASMTKEVYDHIFSDQDTKENNNG